MRSLQRWGAAVAACALMCGSAAAGETADAPAMAERVDRLLAEELGHAPAALARRADDETYLRRVFLDLIGRPPTADDVLAFTLRRGDGKRAAVVEHLLADEAFGANWGRYWRDVILYRRTEPRALLAGASLDTFLQQQFNENRPWDEIAAAFMTATGDVRENGATGLIMAQGGKPEDVAAEVSRIFLGIQIQCAQCHDHPSDDWKREQFHQLAAFFPRVAVRPNRNGADRTFLVTATDRVFLTRRQNNNNRYRGTLEHRMPDLEDPSQPGERMQPVFFVSGESLPFGTRDQQRRAALAAWVTSPENPWFARAFVNRMWAELVGEGFYEPVDDLGPQRESSAPRTLEAMAEGFRDSGHDVKWLFRTVTRTAAYQRDSRSRRNVDELPFQANCPQRLRADQLFDALSAALQLEFPERLRGGGGPYGQRGPRALFNQAFGFDPSDPREEVGVSMAQALAMMNSSFLNRAINARRPRGLGQLLRQHPDNTIALTELYLQTLARAPTEREVRTSLRYIREVGDRAEAFEDLQWALINSTEFLYRR